MDEIQQTIFALENLALAKKQSALDQRDATIEEQKALRNRWRGG